MKFPGSSVVDAMDPKDDFLEEDPTQPERTESLAETLERLRSRTSTRERPRVTRTKSPTENP